MKFTCFGDKNNPKVLLMHGMCQDWHSMYDCLGELDKKYYLIIPGMDGFYDGSGPWTSFSDQCRQIEVYVNENCSGKLYAVYGVSQGTIILSELLSRGNIEIEKMFFDGAYVAHQGRFSAVIMYRLFASAKKNNGSFPKLMNFVMRRMGLTEDDMIMLRYVYWDADNESIRTNMLENYTYHLNPEIANTKAEITLCCGSKEPYALKSHKMIKKYLPNCREIILEGYGHGQMIYQHGKELAEMIVNTW